ncbi:MAG: MotA/TolQ/ExbB proton channel family protein [Helicobacteraceae bacterium]|jgi:biopolymer transport protein ExbB|nr:MotA/TolQ/ExbB proton channel family protein [Helicobacteraceae bacterium]
MDRELVEWIAFGVLGVMGLIALWAAIERIFFYYGVKIGDFTSRTRFEIALNKRLTIIATIATNAPYVGLLGTVFGVMFAFIDIASDMAGLDAGALMTGLALALKATAAGLAVAIPSSIAYNLLLAKAESLLAEWEEIDASKTN